MTALRKNSNTGMIFGVCSGISKWSGIPVVIVRLVFVFGLLSSMGLVGGIYLMLAAILSDEAN